MAVSDTYRYVPDEDDDSGLRPSLMAVRRQWKVVLVVLMLIAGAGGWYAVNIPPSYAAGAIISFEPKNGDVTGSLASLLVERYPQVVSSNTSVEAAAEASGATTSEVSSGLSARVQTDTLNLVMQAEMASNDQAVAAAKSLYASVIQANMSDPDLRAVTVSSPTAWGPVGVSKKLVLAAVLFLAVVLSFVAALVVDGFSQTRE